MLGIFLHAIHATITITGDLHTGVLVKDAATTILAAAPVEPTFKASATGQGLTAVAVKTITDAQLQAQYTKALIDCGTAVDTGAALTLTGGGAAVRYSNGAAASTVDVKLTTVVADAVAGLWLLECSTTMLPLDSRFVYLQYAYTIGKSGDNWDGGKYDEDLTFTGLKSTTTGQGLGYMCFLTGTDTVDIEPVCKAEGTETEINADSRVSDGNVQCTARVTAVAAGSTTLTLKIKNTRLEHMRVRHCTHKDDTSSSAVHLDFKGEGQLTVIFFGLLAFAAVLATTFALLAWNDRRTGGTAPGDVMHGIYEFTGHRWFVVLIAILAAGTTWLAHAEWGNSAEFYVTLSLAIFAVVLPIGLLVWDAQRSGKPVIKELTGILPSPAYRIPRRMRTVSIRT